MMGTIKMRAFLNICSFFRRDIDFQAFAGSTSSNIVNVDRRKQNYHRKRRQADKIDQFSSNYDLIWGFFFTGQQFQSVYPYQSRSFAWTHLPGMYLNESSPIATPACRDHVYAEWRRYWDVSKLVLVEKSPRHILMTRLLQQWFGADRSHFIVILRHPFATVCSIVNVTMNLMNVSQVHNILRRMRLQRDCGESVLRQWLYEYDTLFEDLKHITNKVVLQYETFIKGDTQGEKKELCFST